MPTVETMLDGTIKKLEYSDKLAKGIYFVDNSEQVKKNCQSLQINFDNNASENVAQHKVNELDRCSVITVKAANEYIQYLIFKSASQEDIEELAGHAPEPVAQLIRNTVSPLVQQLNERFKRGF